MQSTISGPLEVLRWDPVGLETRMNTDGKLSELQALAMSMGREVTRKTSIWGRAWFSALLIVILTGCAARSRPRLALPTLNIPLECASSIHLVNCDLAFSPPHCSTVAVNYRHGCEQIVVTK